MKRGKNVTINDSYIANLFRVGCHGRCLWDKCIGIRQHRWKTGTAATSTTNDNQYDDNDDDKHQHNDDDDHDDGQV